MPAPFGPIRAVIDLGATQARPVDRADAAEVLEHVLDLEHGAVPSETARPRCLSLSPHSPRTISSRFPNSPGPERHQPDQEQPGDRQPERRDPGLGERRVGQLDEPAALDHEPEEDRADEDALVVGEAGEDEHAEGEEGDQRLEVDRVKGGEVDRQEEAAGRPEQGGYRQRLELEQQGVLAERASCILVLADRPQHPAPGGLLQVDGAAVAIPTVAQITSSRGNSVAGSLQKFSTKPLIESDTSRQAFV